MDDEDQGTGNGFALRLNHPGRQVLAAQFGQQGLLEDGIHEGQFGGIEGAVFKGEHFLEHGMASKHEEWDVGLGSRAQQVFRFRHTNSAE